MINKTASRSGTSFFVITASMIIIIYGIIQAQSILVDMLVALFLAVLGAPLVLWLQARRIPTAIAVLAVLACMVIALLMIGGVIATSLASFSNSLPFYQQRIQEEIHTVRDFIASKGIIIKDNAVLEYFNLGAVMNLTAGLLTGLTSALSSIVLILLTVTFILLEASSFPVKIRAIMNDPKAEFSQFRKFVGDINHYLLIKTGVSVTTGIIIGVWMSILGVDFPVLWGFLAFLLNYVPNIGVVIAAVPAVLLAVIQYGFGHAALVAGGYLAVNFIIGTIVEPKIVGRGVGLSTLVVFLSLIFWGSLLGLIGMVLCIPFTMTLKFAFENNEQTRWIAILLGPEIPNADVQSESKKKKTP
jgi:AI-2 transport protein TqsA